MTNVSYTRTFARKNRNDGGGELFLGCGIPRWKWGQQSINSASVANTTKAADALGRRRKTVPGHPERRGCSGVRREVCFQLNLQHVNHRSYVP